MSDPIRTKATTRGERTEYWAEVFDEAWRLSRDQFHKEHEVVAALIGLAFKWYVDDYSVEMAVSELVSAAIYVVGATVLYLLGWFLFNFARAMIRVPVYRQRELARLTSEIERLQAPRLQFEFSDALIDRSNQNLTVVRVKVRNSTASTIIGVSVRIESIVKIEETGQINATESYIFRKLPLPLRDDRGYPPHDNIDLHPDDEAIFDLVTLQHHGTETLLHHTRGRVEGPQLRLQHWNQRPSGALASGQYRVQLKAQGRDTPAETLSIEFKNMPGDVWARQVEEQSSLS